MDLDALFVRLAKINADIRGVSRAFVRPPMTLNTADIPAMMAYWRNPMADYSTYAASGRRVVWHLQLEIWGKPPGQGTDYAERMQDLDPFPERVFDAYEDAFLLDDLAGVNQANLAGSVRLVWRTYTTEGQAHPVLEFDLDVEEKQSITLHN